MTSYSKTDQSRFQLFWRINFRSALTSAWFVAIGSDLNTLFGIAPTVTTSFTWAALKGGLDPQLQNMKVRFLDDLCGSIVVKARLLL